jgi:pyrroloquinoline-quinone synthase
MTSQEFLRELDERIAKFDLLTHPFYQAWSKGELTREEIREYASDYYHHVHAFPTYLAELAMRLEDGDLRQTVLTNLADEKGSHDHSAHDEIWLDFAAAFGAHDVTRHRNPSTGVADLMKFYHQTAADGSPQEAIAAFYAYESQVPRLAAEKERGLKAFYNADDNATRYFTLHKTADLEHAASWRQELARQIEAAPESSEKALHAAEQAARSLWNALDGIEAARLQIRAA